MNTRLLFLYLVAIFLLALTLFNSLNWLRDQAEYALRKQERQHDLILLVANEFTLVSRDLTRYARVFVRTHHPDGVILYHKLLDWSRGKAERPQHRNKRLDDILSHHKMSQVEIMKFLGLSGNDLMRFEAAVAESDFLATLEMQAIESIASGEYVEGPSLMLEGETLQEFADRTVHDPPYRTGLQKIAEVMDEFHDSQSEQIKILREESQYKIWWLQVFTWIIDSVLILLFSLFLSSFLRSIQQESINRLRTVLDNTPLAIDVFDEQNKLMMCNQKMLDLFGVTSLKERLANFDKLHLEKQPDGTRTQDLMIAATNEARKTGFVCREVIHKNMAGDDLLLEATLTRIPYKNNFLLMATVRDLREIKVLQATANDVNARMQILIEAMPFGCMIWDEKGNVLECNQKLVALCGVENQQECVARFADLSPPIQSGGRRSQVMLQEQIGFALRARLMRFEWNIISVSGEEIPTEITLVRVIWNQKLSVAGYIRDLRDLRAMQAATEQANNRAKLMLEAMPFGCTIWDNNGHVLGCNRAKYVSLGIHSESEFIERFNELIPEKQPDGRNSRKAVMELIKQTFDQGSLHTEFTYLNLAGDLIPSEIHLIRSDWNDAQVVLSYSRDLREEKKLRAEAEAVLRRSQFILNAAPVPIDFWNENGEVIDCNAAILQILGATSREEYLTNFYKFSPEFQPDGKRSADAASEYIRQAFAEGFQRFNWTHLTAAGEELPAEVTLSRVWYENSPIVIAAFRDLREEQKLLAAAEEAHHRLRFVFDAAPVPLHFWNEKFEIIDCNLANLRLFGATSREEYLTNFLKFSPEFQPDGKRTQDAAGEYLTRAFTDGYCRFNWAHVTVAGEAFLVEVTLSCDYYKNQPIMIAAVHDLRAEQQRIEVSEEASRRARFILDAAPIAIDFWNEKHELVDCNVETLRLFGVASSEEYVARFPKLSPEFQPDGKRSVDAAAEYLEKTLRDGYCRFKWIHFTAAGEEFPAEITLSRVIYNDVPMVIASVRDLREEQQLRAESEEANARVQLLLDTTPMGCFLWDEQCKLIDCNLEAVVMLSLSDKQELHKKFSKLMPELQANGRPSWELLQERLYLALKMGYQRFDWLYCTPSQESRPVEMRLIRMKWEDSYIIAGYARDLREHRAMQMATEAAMFRSRLMVETTPYGCVLRDEKSNFLDCSAATLRLFEVNSSEEYIANFSDLFPRLQPNGKLSSDMIRESYQVVLEKGEHRFECLHQTFRTRQLLPVEISMFRVQEKDQTIVATYIRDLREQKALESTTREANHRTQLMLDTTPMGCVVIDENHKLLDCNLELVRLFDLESKQEYLNRFFELSPEYQADGRNSKESAQMQIAETLEHGFMRFEWMHQTLDGEPRPCQISLYRVPWGNGFVVMAYTRDLRELKKAQATLKAEQSALRQARDDAEASARAKSEFLANMSHEIRTPLTAILGYNEITADSDTSLEERVEAAGIIRNSAEYLLHLINDILDLSKLDAEKVQMELRPIALVPLVDSVIAIHANRAKEKGISLEFTSSTPLPTTVSVDSLRLNQILINLLGNSIKFTLRGGVTLDVSWHSYGENSRCGNLHFAVRDTGIGMSRGTVNALFQPFQQADSSTSRKFGGTGLGLAISHRLVGVMGGKIEVTSELGQGTTFTIILPQELASDTVWAESLTDAHRLANSQQKEKEATKATSRALQSYRVLLAEDSVENQRLFKVILSKAGAEVFVVENGQEAYDQAMDSWRAEKVFDIIIMDMQMPVLDGYAAINKLRSSGYSFPIIALTANAFPEEMKRCFDTGCDDYASKPITRDAFIDVVARNVLKGKNS